MCGIDGIVVGRRVMPRGAVAERLAVAEAAQAHRGPDGAGQAVNGVGDWWVGLGHQRLAIIDLSDRAAQPMTSATNDDVLVYNGEVFDYVELRERLAAQGATFRSDSDTEVVATALRLWGVERALNAFNGMWALAWLDLREGRLVLARDRMGIKPLYLDVTGDRVAFSSEIKALLAMDPRRRALNLETVGAYLQQALIDQSPATFFQDIVSLPGGCYASIDLRAEHLKVEAKRYWTAPSHGGAERVPDDQLHAEIRELFFDAVRLRLRADVPVGVLLSGGVDSSAIAAAAAAQPGVDVALLSAVSADARFDESRHADVMAHHLGRETHKVSVDLGAQEAFDLLGKVTWHHDEPVGSFSSVAHYLLMQAASAIGVKVVLSGQGADELLCGYKKYVGFQLQALVRARRPLAAMRQAGAAMRQGTLVRQFNLAEARRYLPGVRNVAGSDLGAALATVHDVPVGLGKDMTIQERQALDLTSLSVPQLTHYEDRMSMAHGREVRLPFLDYRLVEKLLPLDPSLKLREGWTKHVFRKALAADLPDAIAWRRDKQGFTLPQSEWLRHDLRPQTLELFAPDAMVFGHGLLRREPFLATYARYADLGERKSGVWYRQIFNRLALEVWLRRFADHLEPVTVPTLAKQRTPLTPALALGERGAA